MKREGKAGQRAFEDRQSTTQAQKLSFPVSLRVLVYCERHTGVSR